MICTPAATRYEHGLPPLRRQRAKLPALSLGLWHNFGEDSHHKTKRAISPHRLRPRHHPLRPRQQLRPAAGLRRDRLRRDSSTDFARPSRRADHLHQGRLRDVARPHGEWGSRKNLLASLDSLKRLGLDYVDIFIAPLRPDTPLEETMGASTPPSAPARRSTSASPPTTPTAPAPPRRS